MSAKKLSKRRCGRGLSYVEILISMALMGLVALSTSMYLVKANTTSGSLSMRSREALEIQAFLNDLEQDLSQGAYISNNSHRYRLEYTTWDADGDPVKKIYRINGNGAAGSYLELSTDNGSTWDTPFKMSTANRYTLSLDGGLTPRFYYAGLGNNCTDFNDNDTDGIWEEGADPAGTVPGDVCPGMSGSITEDPLVRPAQANKVVLYQFKFTNSKGSPVAERTLPTAVVIAVAPGLVRSTATPLPAPGVKDPPLIQSFATNEQYFLYDASESFIVRGVALDPGRRRLIITGHRGDDLNDQERFYFADRNGVLMSYTKDGTRYGPYVTLSSTTIVLDSVDMLDDGHSVIALDATSAIKNFYEFDLNSTGAITATNTQIINAAVIASPKGIMYDSGAPLYCYIVGQDPTDSSKWKVFEVVRSSGALSGNSPNKWTLPQGASDFDGTHPASGLSLEPINGDFLVVRNYVDAGQIKTYRIKRTDASVVDTYTITLSDLGDTTTTGTNGNFGLAYESSSNRFFLTNSDSLIKRVYEIAPDKLVSPRSQ